MTGQLTRKIILVLLGLLIAPTLFAQEPSVGRRTDFEYVEAGFDLYGFGDVNFPGSDYWNTPEGKQRYLENQLERFHKNVGEFGEIGMGDWLGLYGAASDRSTIKELENRSGDLEKVTKEMIEFLEWAYGAPPLEAESVSSATLENRLEQISVLVELTLPAVSAIQIDAALDVQVFTRMRHDLAQIHELSRSLQD